jgi:hypothetical protein
MRQSEKIGSCGGRRKSRPVETPTAAISGSEGAAPTAISPPTPGHPIPVGSFVLGRASRDCRAPRSGAAAHTPRPSRTRSCCPPRRRARPSLRCVRTTVRRVRRRRASHANHCARRSRGAARRGERIACARIAFGHDAPAAIALNVAAAAVLHVVDDRDLAAIALAAEAQVHVAIGATGRARAHTLRVLTGHQRRAIVLTAAAVQRIAGRVAASRTRASAATRCNTARAGASSRGARVSPARTRDRTARTACASMTAARAAAPSCTGWNRSIEVVAAGLTRVARFSMAALPRCARAVTRRARVTRNPRIAIAHALFARARPCRPYRTHSACRRPTTRHRALRSC